MMNLLKSMAQLMLSLMQISLQAFVHSSAGNKSVVVGSNYGERIDPNAIAICRSASRNGIEVYLITDCEDTQLESESIQVLARGSCAAARAVKQASHVFYTHSFSDLIPQAHKLSLFVNLLIPCKRIFLQHGMIGLKSRLGNNISLKDYIMSLEPTFDYMVVSSNTESAIVESFGVPKTKLLLTGLPRFDDYFGWASSSKNLFVFFTWKNDGLPNGKALEIEQSAFIKAWRVAGQPIIHQQHHMVKNSQANATQSIAEILRQTAVLITDDSSVALECLLLGKEVVFFQPETQWLRNDEFLQSRTSHTLLEFDLVISKALRGELTPVPLISPYLDGRCCRRILQAVKLD